METINQEREYAGFWIRLSSILLDNILIIFILFTILLILKLFYPVLSYNNFTIIFLIVLISISIIGSFIYYCYYNSNGRQTLGKWFFGIQVVNEEGEPISFKQSFYRTLLFLFDSILYSIGHLFIIFSKRKQALHDLLSKTYVIRKVKKRKLEQLFTVCIILLEITLMIFYVYFQILHFTGISSFVVQTGAMEPTINANDYILSDWSYYEFNDLKSGDIIIFKYPKDESQYFVKRCVALSGQFVEIKDGNLYVDGSQEGKITANNMKNAMGDVFSVEISNGTKYNIQRLSISYAPPMKYNNIKVPANHCFVMGDNRDNSDDSRYWGFVPLKNIVAKPTIKYYSGESKMSVFNFYLGLKIELIN